MIDPALADRFAAIALGHVRREYPHKLDHVLDGEGDALPPRLLHPVFHGSFDWHSCVHGYWLLARLLRRGARAGEITALFDEMLVSDKLAVELAYLDRPSSAGFERPYGWAWALMLHAELVQHDAAWGAAFEPLARAFAARFRDYLPRLTYPIRAGTHANTAFALLLARVWAERHDRRLLTIVDGYVRRAYGDDRDGGRFEPSGDDFLSPALVEAAVMRAALPADAFAGWLAAFLPNGGPPTLRDPVFVSDRGDGKIAHLDGVNLSRAWCWRVLADALTAPEQARAAAECHFAAALPHIDGDYAGSHWLATFALLAIEGLR